MGGRVPVGASGPPDLNPQREAAKKRIWVRQSGERAVQGSVRIYCAPASPPGPRYLHHQRTGLCEVGQKGAPEAGQDGADPRSEASSQSLSTPICEMEITNRQFWEPGRDAAARERACSAGAEGREPMSALRDGEAGRAGLGRGHEVL